MDRATQNAPKYEAHTRARVARWPLVLLLIAALLGAGYLRQLAASQRGGNAQTGAIGSPLSRMNSFALALLLGGLRGPLVMVLWTSSESQKQDKDLEDFDTKVEWIRLLQPEFDTVHIFQMWNKAYNISVLKASLINKYLTILDALDYGSNVNRERPDDINIVYQIGAIYFDKLGQSQEKKYYTQHVRTETLPHPPRQKLGRNDPAWRRLDLDPMLDAQGNLLPELLKPTSVLLADPADPGLKYDGAELPFLAKYQPYPDGLSPLALGYNYYQRAELLQRLGHQKHAQLSDLVVDSRPALGLKFWGEEENERARRLELQGFAKPIPTEKLDLEAPAAGVPLDQSIDPSVRPVLEHARSIYDLAGRLAEDSRASYSRHMLAFKESVENNRSQVETLLAEQAMSAADRDYLGAMLASDAATRDKLAALAAQEYRAGVIAYEKVLFHFYLSDLTARRVFPTGVDRSTIDQVDPSKYDAIAEKVKHIVFDETNSTESKEDVDEYFRYITRGKTRMAHLPK